MPATESTWRNQKFMHMVFGLTSALMLFCTLWMLASDHNREWKQYQRQFQNVEAYAAKSRINAQESAAYYDQQAKLDKAVDEAKSEAPDDELVEAFVAEAKGREKESGYRLGAIETAAAKLAEAKARGGASQEELIELRQDLVGAMQTVLAKAKLDEDNAQRELKFKRADLDVARSKYNISVGEGKPQNELIELENEVKAVEKEVDKLTYGSSQDRTIGYQQRHEHRLALQKILDRVNAGVAAAEKTLADHQTELKRLEATLAERQSNWRKSLLENPIIDAFGRPLKIDNIWLPQLTINNNFRDVARFDRCTTCHQGIDKTAPGSPVNPGYPATERETLVLATPAENVDFTGEQKEHLAKLEKEASKAEYDEQKLQYQLVQNYGFQLARQGLFDANETTVSVVRPETAAANAKLEPGDAIEQINDVKLLNRDRAIELLLEFADWGKPVQLHVRRGIPHPFSSHPRLDLFVGSLSPHKLGDVGCSICHDGQGSATAFKWASHTPNSPAQEEEWGLKYGWFNNHHWIFPMPSKRFAESTCLKCHHDVAELEPSERFPDPPAEKLMAGYKTIEKFGCFGCHEINGFDGPSKRRGPDLRAEPPFFAAAQQLLTDPNLTDREKELAREVAAHPERTATRKLLAELIARSIEPAKGGEGEGDEREKAGEPRLSADSLALGKMLGADDETPGQYRKVGPSLRHVGKKVDLPFLYSWIKNPTNFRPTTRMPRFFGLWDHLETDVRHDPTAHPSGHAVPQDSKGLADAKQFEPVEVRAVAEYLLAYSQPFEYAEPPKNITEEASAERGKHLFQVRGCLACHQHKEFPEAKQTQGPDLSRIGAKLDSENGKQWLYSWVLEPNRYHARTVMPNLYLTAIADEKDPQKVSYPAADIAAYLLTSQEDWKPEEVPQLDKVALDELTKTYLLASFSSARTKVFLSEGIPNEAEPELKADEKLLLQGEGDSGETLDRKKLLYVGRRTIARLGCSGCHDVPGFEDAKPIGTGLADWGRKDTSKLAFEQILEYLREKPPAGGHAHGEHAADGEHHALDPDEMDQDTGFFVEALLHHEREGFLWQKLREPRSYDFKMTENKAYTDRLRMPKFNFTPADIENVMTFVLGLVAEPPAAKYVYHAKPRRKAVVEGEQILAKYNCVGCHTVKMETWEFEYKPDEFESPPAIPDYAFLQPHFTPAELAASKRIDQRGMGHAAISGMPNPDVQEDDDGNPLYLFSLWAPAAINGEVWSVGGVEVPVPLARRLKVRPFEGGDFSRYLHPVAVEMGKKNNPNVKPSDVWGWVPPPLIREGAKVQTGWLRDFLLDPFPLRPAVVLRMPRFNMSAEEADKLVRYFAAVDEVDYPYEYHLPGGGDALSGEAAESFGTALELVTDGKNYCVKCHMLGDYKPKGLAADMAPNLDRIYQRLRPDYLREWLAHPQVKLPYTGMPVNFPPQNDPNEAIRTKYVAGTSEDALQSVVGLLLNFDSYVKRKTSIKSMVKEPPPGEVEKAALDETAEPQAKASGGR